MHVTASLELGETITANLVMTTLEQMAVVLYFACHLTVSNIGRSRRCENGSSRNHTELKHFLKGFHPSLPNI